MSKRIASRIRSKQLYQEAEKLLVGGVNSPVRAFQSVGGDPLVISHASGPHLFDVDGNQYIDYVCGWGPMILGHAHPAVVAAIREQAAKGTSYGMSSELELELARMVTQAMPALGKMRFVSSGTEATMSAIRVARAFTKRNLIVKFEGCYHGHADSFLSQAGSGLATLGIAASPGVPNALAQLTLNLPYNDLTAVEKAFAYHANQIGAVIVEPVAANMGVVAPVAGYLAGLREITRKHGALLIFDEVISGFRVAYSGAQSLYNIQPDLTTLGKIIGGGLPVAAYGGRSDIMNLIAPLGPVYQAGTLSGNALGMCAGIATLQQLQAPNFYNRLNKAAERLAGGLRAALRDSGVAGQVHAVGSLMTIFFCDAPVSNYEDAKKSDTQRFAAFFREMLSRGVFLPPSQFEAWFVSVAHLEEHIEQTLTACRESLHALRSGVATAS